MTRKITKPLVTMLLLLSGSSALFAADPVPSPLTPADVGKPQPSGSEVYTCVSGVVMLPHCRFDVVSGGSLGSSKDEGRFISQSIPDDANVSVRVVESRGESAGIMLRQEAAPDGARIALTVGNEGKLTLSIRSTKSSGAKELAHATVSFPCDLRINREGNKITAWHRETDGIWQKFPETTWGETGTPLLAGLWVAGGPARLADWDALLRGHSTPFGGNWGDGDSGVDLVKAFSRPFYKVEKDEPAPTGADGWPTSDFKFTMSESLGLPDRSVHNGTFTLVWEGADDAEVSCSLRPNEVTLGGKWHPKPGVSVQTVTYTFPKAGTTGWNPNLNSIFLKKTGGTLHNLRVLRPGYAWNTEEVFHRPVLALARHCTLIRTMCMNNTNGSLEKTWRDRAHVSDVSYAAHGRPWEQIVLAANTLHRDLWINIPMMVDDEYITKLAQLLAFGSDASGEPYAGPTKNPVYAPLDPSLKLYIENSNEVWNGGFTQSQQAATMAKEYQANPKPTAGFMPKMTAVNAALPWEMASQFHVKRTIDISNLFRAVFGDEAMISRVRPTLGLQNTDHSSQGSTYFPWVEAEYGKPVSYFLHSICVAPYWVPIEGNYAKSLESRDSATVEEFFAHMVPAAAEVYKPLHNHVTTTIFYGIKTIAYEGGVFVMDNISRLRPASLRMLKDAYADDRYRKIISDSQRGWFTGGGDEFSYFTVNVGPLGHFNVTNDVRNQATQVLHGLDDVATAALPSVETGFLVDEPVELNASWMNGGENLSVATIGVNAKGWPGTECNYLLRCTHDVKTPVRLRLAGGTAGQERTFEVLLDHQKIGQWNIPADPAKPAVDSPEIALSLTKGLHTLRLVTTGETNAKLVSLIFGNPRNTRPQIFGIDNGTWNMIVNKPRPSNTITVSDFETTDLTKLNFTVTSDNPVLFPADALQLTHPANNPTAWLLTLQPAPDQQGAANITLTATDPDGGVSRVIFPAKVNAPGVQLLTLGKPAGCSALGHPGTMTAGMVNDGNMGTAWESPVSDDQYVWIDLGKPCFVDSVRIRFGENPARDFRILTSKYSPNFYWGPPGLQPLARGTVTGNTAKEVKIDGFGQTIRYLWLWVDHRVDPKKGAMVAELEAYGSEETPGIRRIRCGGPATGGFVGDVNFTGGGEAKFDKADISLAGVSDPAPIEAYRSARSGESQYRVTGLTPNSTQRVRLHFAECQFSKPGQRVFNIDVNGTHAVSDFDILAASGGQGKAFVKEAETNADAEGVVTVKLLKSVDQPLVCALEVLDAKPAGPAPRLLAEPTAGAPDETGQIFHFSAKTNAPASATWSMLSAPANVEPLIFPKNGTVAAREMDITFAAPGSYKLAVVTADAAGRGENREVNFEVPRLAKSLRILWPPENVYDDVPIGMGAFFIDQFGRDINRAPHATWTISPGGAGGTLEVDDAKGECRYKPELLTENKALEIVAVADGLTGRYNTTVVPNCRPQVDTPAAALDPVLVGKPIRLSVAASHRLGADQLIYSWDLVDGPSGTSWPQFGADNGTGKAAQTTVILPKAGTWRLRCLITDKQARNAVSEVVLNTDPSAKTN